MRLLLLSVIVLLHSAAVAAPPAPSLVQAAGLSPFTSSTPAADFQLASHEGATLRLQEQRGKVVFLNFWATWCAPCRHEMPLMQQLYQAFRQHPFVMWAVALQESREDVVPFMGENGLRFPALLDTEGEVTGLYAVRGLPTTYLIDCTGNIVGRATGERQWTHEAVYTLLQELFSDVACRKMPQDK